MNTVEPILFRWEGDGIETDGNYQRRCLEWEWDMSSDFLLHKAAIELCEEISPYTLQEEYAEIVDSVTEPIRNVLPLSDQQLVIGEVSSRQGRDKIYYVRGESVIIPAQRSEGVARIVSNNKNAARDLRGKLKNKLVEIAEQFHGAGIENLEVFIGGDFTLENITHPNAEISIDKGEPDEFESQVLDELTPLSEAFVSNVKVNFIDYSPEPEYDILLASGPYGLLQIEVKDYSGTDNEPGEEEAIHRPLRKASLLDISQTISVIKGVDSMIMDQLRKNSELRNQIQITEKHELKESVIPLLERTISGGPGFYPIR